MNPYGYYQVPQMPQTIEYHSYVPLDPNQLNGLPQVYDPNRQPQQLERRVDRLERENERQEREINQLQRRLQRVNQRLRAVERRLNLSFTPFDGEY